MPEVYGAPDYLMPSAITTFVRIQGHPARLEGGCDDGSGVRFEIRLTLRVSLT